MIFYSRSMNSWSQFQSVNMTIFFLFSSDSTLSRGSLYEVVFSDIINIITIMITIICLFAAVVPPMEGTTDSVHFG